ncbi:hypothetical protein AAFF_G00399530 [Aldrovandia affinis]|uniref:Uncharacterized protein n=1 Tax=Aldrovandia affinis TaxID=143900 RepID=A0AAD7WLA8_9TELE|nr:hypothetical protein AAFF_G00399530 [Aldrovandia affinis]
MHDSTRELQCRDHELTHADTCPRPPRFAAPPSPPQPPTPLYLTSLHNNPRGPINNRYRSWLAASGAVVSEGDRILYRPPSPSPRSPPTLGGFNPSPAFGEGHPYAQNGSAPQSGEASVETDRHAVPPTSLMSSPIVRPHVPPPPHRAACCPGEVFITGRHQVHDSGPE